MQTNKMPSIFQYFNSTLLGVILTFVLISGITTSLLSNKLSSDYISDILNKLDLTSLYSQVLHSENHFFPEISGSEISISKLFFQVATNIKLDDTRTLLGRELPALTFYHTNIIVAEDGATIADLPVESIPSDEILQNPKEVDEEKIEEEENNNAPVTEPSTKTVFIYHTHNLESYLPLLKDASESDEAISSDQRVTVVKFGKKLTDLLQKEGIGTEHDTTNINQELLDRKWKYYASYSVSKEVVEAAINENDQLSYLIDIHRDSLRKEKTTATIDGKSYAKVYFIIGEANENYEKNAAFAKKLHERLNEKYPGISRGVGSKGQDEGNGIYNQNYSDKAILLELGGVDNTQDELTRTTEAFADVFSEIYWDENGASEQ